KYAHDGVKSDYDPKAKYERFHSARRLSNVEDPRDSHPVVLVDDDHLAERDLPPVEQHIHGRAGRSVELDDLAGLHREGVADAHARAADLDCKGHLDVVDAAEAARERRRAAGPRGARVVAEGPREPAEGGAG